MMPLDIPVTPLVNGMWRWGYKIDGVDDVGSNKMQACASKAVATQSATGASLPSQPPQKSAAAKAREHYKSAITKPYRSVDPATGRVWGAPNAGGRGQCLDCPNRAMAAKTRCEACLHKLAEATYELISPDFLVAVRSSFNAAVNILPTHAHKDTTDRLQLLYAALEARRIPPPIQSVLLSTAQAIAAGDMSSAMKLVTKLSGDHWDEHKEWLKGMKRLASAQPGR